MSLEDVIAKLMSEDKLNMADAGAAVGALECGKPVTAETVVRWCLKGVLRPGGARLHLEHFRAAGRLVTSRQALVRFFAAQTQTSAAPLTRTPTERRRASEQAAAELAAMGV